MQRDTKRILILFLVMALTLAFTATVAAAEKTRPTVYLAHLSGDQEVPPVKTDARGKAGFVPNSDASAMNYQLLVMNIENVVASHIHCAPEGVNGPVGVTLFAGGPVSPDGVLAQGTITAPDDGNSCGWQSLADVIAAIEAGDAYVNVHTTTVPSGEIRGQLN
jgi:hypothetical protein